MIARDTVSDKNFQVASDICLLIIYIYFGVNFLECYIRHLEAFVGNIQKNQVDGLVQDCSNSIANAPELLQYCAKPMRWFLAIWIWHTLKYSIPQQICTQIIQYIVWWNDLLQDDFNPVIQN